MSSERACSSMEAVVNHRGHVVFQQASSETNESLLNNSSRRRRAATMPTTTPFENTTATSDAYVTMDSIPSRPILAASNSAPAAVIASNVQETENVNYSNDNNSTIPSHNPERFEDEVKLEEGKGSIRYSCCSCCCGCQDNACFQELKSLLQELMIHSKEKNWKKKVLTITIVCSSLFVFYDLFFIGRIQKLEEQFVMEWMADHPSTAVVAFIAFFAFTTLVFIPPPLLVFGAGYAFSQAIGLIPGIIAAFLATFLGCCIGAVIAFARSRYMMRDTIQLFAKRYPIVRAADKALKRNGFYILLLLRLCPIIPFNGLNYIGGVTGVKWDEFTFALIGIAPMQLLTVVMGATAESFFFSTKSHNDEDVDDDEQKALYRQKLGLIICICAGIAFAIIAVIWTWKLAKEELQKELELESDEMETYLQDSMATTTNKVASMFSCNPAEHDHEAGIASSPPTVAWFVSRAEKRHAQRRLRQRDSSVTNVMQEDTLEGANRKEATGTTEMDTMYTNMESNVSAAEEVKEGEDEEWFWVWS